MFALALCLVMVLGMVPATALATENADIREQIGAQIGKNAETKTQLDPQIFEQLKYFGDYCFTENEPNNDYYEADVVYHDMTIFGDVGGYDMDWFYFELYSQTELFVLLQSGRPGVIHTILDSYGEEILYISEDGGYSDGYYYDLIDCVLPSGEYCMVIIDLDVAARTDYLYYFSAIPVGGSIHTHSYSAVVTPPTCSTQGYTTYTCSCGYSFTDAYIPATAAHTDGNGDQHCDVCGQICYSDTGEYYFSSLSELVDFCAYGYQSGEEIYCYCTSDYPMTINTNLTIPENVSVYMELTDVTIASGKTVAVEGLLVAKNLTINGVVNVAASGEIGASERLTVNGQANVLGRISLPDGLNSQIIGANRVNFAGDGGVDVSAFVCYGTDVVTLANIAEAMPENWVYRVTLTEADSISTDLTIPENMILCASMPLEVTGDVYVAGQLIADAPVYLGGKVTNLGWMQVWHGENGGTLTIGKPEAYVDTLQNVSGSITVSADAIGDGLFGLSQNDFTTVDGESGYWYLSGYKGNASAHVHTPVLDAAVAPTCLTYGRTEGTHCATCGDELIQAEKLAPLGHMYSDFYDTTCDVCGAARVVNPTHLTSSMYRMYNPNTGEHFYTGSMVERRNIEAAGWKYEGVGFTICANEGAPVYRLYQPSTGEHLYTMDPAEKNYLAARGWNVEGIAFNSCPKMDVPQYRLFNPNATIGAYHFTASVEERDNLISLGWQYQGIGFYTCLQ